MEAPPILFDRYHFVRDLSNKGGFADTYVYQDTHLHGEEVVVKVLRPNTSPQALKYRALFEREGEILHQLKNKGAFPEAKASPPGEPIHVMEYIPGKTLDEELTGLLLVEGVQRLLEELLEVAIVLQRNRIIHRDLSPRNFIRRDQPGHALHGKLHVIDFGLAREGETEGETDDRSKTMAYGTEAYASPEQAYGDAFWSSDLYAVGRIALRAWLGKTNLPRREKDNDWQPPVQPGAQQLAQFLKSLTRVDHEKRAYQNAQVALDALRRLTLSLPLQAKNPPTFPVPQLLVTPTDTSTVSSPAVAPKTARIGSIEQLPRPIPISLSPEQSKEQSKSSEKEQSKSSDREKAAPIFDEEYTEQPNRRLLIGGVIGGCIVAGTLGILGLNRLIKPGTDRKKLTTAAVNVRAAGFPELSAYLDQMCEVPAGSFIMGSDEGEDEKPRHQVNLSAYWIGNTEVTVALWHEYAKARLSGQMPSTPSFNEYWMKSDHPIVNVSWQDIMMGDSGHGGFCAWASYVSGILLTLPSEAQWEKAARGTDGRKYPWGNEWNPWKLGGSSAAGTVRVGNARSGASPYGCLDMAGNVWEWCNDWYAFKYNENDKKDPSGPEEGTYKVLRGGSWLYSGVGGFRCPYRSRSAPTDRNDVCGFRLSSPNLG